MPARGENIAHDLACVRCGYNLHGLNATDHCPECHADVNASVVRAGLMRLTASAPSLAQTDPVHARGVVAGMWLCAAAIMIQWITPSLTTLGAGALMTSIELFARCASWGCLIAGVFQLTRLDADREGLRETWHARWTVLAYAALSLAQIYARTPTLVLVFRGLAGIYATVLVQRLLSRVAGQLPSRWLAAMCYFSVPFIGLIALMSGAIGTGGQLRPPMTFGPHQALGAELAGIGWMQGRPGLLIANAVLALLGSGPLFFLVLWYVRPRPWQRGRR